MENLIDEIFKKISILNLTFIEESISKKILAMAIKSVKNFIDCEINPFIEFSLIKDTFIDIVIGEYLILVKNSGIDSEIDPSNAIKSIKEGDTNITYFENRETSIDSIIGYFIEKKKNLYNFKVLKW